MAFTEFYCNASTGSNLNAGDDPGTVTYTSTNGNWNGGTIFTPTDGSNPVAQGVSIGQYASVFLDAATVGVYVARITNVVNSVNGAITLSSTIETGTAPTAGASGRSIKVGGAWKGPNAASGFPFTLNTLGNLRTSASTPLRVNLKNNSTYSVTAQFTMPNGGQKWIAQGYSSNPGDGGKATIDGGTSTGAVMGDATGGYTFRDLIFSTSIATGTTDLVSVTNVDTLFERCVFTGARNYGLNGSTLATGISLIECEFYNCNTANTLDIAAVILFRSTLRRCFIHGNSGSNGDGVNIGSGSLIVQDCVIADNGKRGIISSGGVLGVVEICNTDFYNNTSDAINIGTSSANIHWIENCNFIKNGGKGINNQSTAPVLGRIYNCGYGSGTQANGSADTIGNLEQGGSVTYPNDLTPWVDPANGDFSIVLISAIGVGRGVFTETAPSYSGTIGYPDIGAAQSNPELFDEGVAGIGGG